MKKYSTAVAIVVALVWLALVFAAVDYLEIDYRNGEHGRPIPLPNYSHVVSTHVPCLVCDKNPVDMLKPPAYTVTQKLPAGLALCSQACADKYKANPAAYTKGTPEYFKRMVTEHAKWQATQQSPRH